MNKYFKLFGVGITRQLFIVLCLLILVVSFSGCAAWKAYWADDPPVIIPKERLRTTVATYVRYVWRYSESNYSLFEYEVDGVLYRLHSNKYGFVPGEKFMLQYDDLDPSDRSGAKNMMILFSQPVFLSGERTTYTWGELKKTGKYYNIISYTYHIDGDEKEYHRILYLPEGDIVKNHPQLLVPGAKFVVEYWLDNPKRSILYINMPINDTIPVPSNTDTYKIRPQYGQYPVIPISDSIRPLKNLYESFKPSDTSVSSETKYIIKDTSDNIGCDTIYFKSGKVEYCKIYSTNADQIIYVMCDDPEGSTMIVSTDFISKIRYANGQEDIAPFSTNVWKGTIPISSNNENKKIHTKSRIQSLAIPSLLLSLLSIVSLLILTKLSIIMAFFLSLMGLIFSFISLDKIDRINRINGKGTDAHLRGRLFAAYGLYLSYIVFILFLIAIL
jgi:hypothetical protein